MVLLLTGFSVQVQSQELSVYGGSLQGILAEKQWSGGARGSMLGVNYYSPGEHLQWLLGGELSSVSWGYNVVANIGIDYTADITDKWLWTVTALSQHGIALFKPSPLYTLGVEFTGSIGYRLTQRSSLQLGIGIRMYNCPGYSKYSLISRYLDWPVELSYRIKL